MNSQLNKVIATGGWKSGQVCPDREPGKIHFFRDIIIRQDKDRCQVWHGDCMVFTGGRVKAKQKAIALHNETGDPVFNYKASGALVQTHGKKGGRKVITTEAELHSANRAVVLGQLLKPVRSYRIAWKWQRGNHLFGATTFWLCRGDRDAALRDFANKNPNAISFRVVEEVV